MSKRDDDFDESADMPDLAAMEADDRLLDMIASGRVENLPRDDELAQVLVAWQADIDSEPMPSTFDGDVAVRMMRAANNPNRTGHRKGGRPMLVPLAAAAALSIVALSGVSVAAKSAEPGDPLFSVTKVLYSDYADSAEAAKKVEDQLEEANAALEEGRPLEAVQSLQLAETELPEVDKDEGADDLREKLEQLRIFLEERMKPTTDPADPSGPSEATSPDESTDPSESSSPQTTDPSSESSEPSTTDPTTESSEPSTTTGDGTSAPTGSEPASTGAPSAPGSVPSGGGGPTT